MDDQPANSQIHEYSLIFLLLIFALKCMNYPNFGFIFWRKLP